MDISRLVDFSGAKPVLKQGVAPIQFIPIAPDVKKQSWVNGKIRSIFSNAKKNLARRINRSR